MDEGEGRTIMIKRKEEDAGLETEDRRSEILPIKGGELISFTC
jgi:hypothetical protein